MPASREKPPKSRLSENLADKGRKIAAQRAAQTIEKITRAQRVIEADLERHGGVYPYEGGRLSTEEVLRRAGLHRALLQKPRHRALRDQVNAWVAEIKKKQLKGKKVVRKAVTERADRAEDEIAQIRQRWAEAELEFAEQANEVARMTSKCAKLEAEVARLKIEMSGDKTAQLNPNEVTDLLREPPSRSS